LGEERGEERGDGSALDGSALDGVALDGGRWIGGMGCCKGCADGWAWGDGADRVVCGLSFGAANVGLAAGSADPGLSIGTVVTWLLSIGALRGGSSLGADRWSGGMGCRSGCADC
jgi:hypothetical protein